MKKKKTIKYNIIMKGIRLWGCGHQQEREKIRLFTGNTFHPVQRGAGCADERERVLWSLKSVLCSCPPPLTPQKAEGARSSRAFGHSCIQSSFETLYQHSGALCPLVGPRTSERRRRRGLDVDPYFFFLFIFWTDETRDYHWYTILHRDESFNNENLVLLLLARSRSIALRAPLMCFSSFAFDALSWYVFYIQSVCALFC